MDDNTRAARREARESVKPKINKRSRLILDTLGSREMTASEITEELAKVGAIPYFNRNFVAPRLTELKEAGILETVGRRKATRSNIFESVWARTQRQRLENATPDARDACPEYGAAQPASGPPREEYEQLTLLKTGG